jgi:PAS domain S-box-containing protein
MSIKRFQVSGKFSDVSNSLQASDVLDYLPVAVYACDNLGYITDYNKSAATLWGREPEIGKDLWCGSSKILNNDNEPIAPDECPMARSLKEGVCIEGEPIIIERQDGTRINVLSYPVPRFDLSGTLIGGINTLIDITGQVKMDQKQAMLAAIVDTSDDAIISKTLQGIITSWNQAAERMFGYTEAETLGKHISIIIPANRIAEEETIINNIAKGNAIIHFETYRLTKYGKEIPISLSVSAIRDQDGRITGASKIARDLTDVYAADEKKAVLSAIVDTSDDAIINKNLQGIVTSWNKSAEKTFGYSQDEAIGKHISLIIPQDRLSEEEIIIQNISAGNRIDHFETIRIKKDGDTVPILLSVSPIKDKSGNVIGASKIARDISERKIAGAKQAMLAAIVDTSDDAIISKTLQGIVTSWNKAAEKTFGYTENEVIGKHISFLIPKDRLQEEEIIIRNVANGIRVDHFETVRLTKSGQPIPISLSVSPIKDDNGIVIGASKIARDISALKTALLKTQRYAEHLEVINSLSRTISEDLDMEVILQKITDITTQLTGAQFGAFIYTDRKLSTGEVYTLCTSSGASKQEFEQFNFIANSWLFNFAFTSNAIIRIDDINKVSLASKGLPRGHPPVASYLGVPLTESSANIIAGLFFVHAEAGMFTREHEVILQAISLQAVIALQNARLYKEVVNLNLKKDEFIGMASHELRTPLTSISGYLQILDRLETNEKSKRFVSKTVRQVRKLSSLVSDLLDVSKIEAGKLELNKRHFNIKRIVEEAIELIQDAQISHQINFISNVDVLTITADPQRIEQVIINLLTNAIKYSPAGKKVDVVLEDLGSEVKIGVKDSGIGIKPDKQKNIFNRFYRVEDLNPSMAGLGIGLYICKEITERHGGKLWVDSAYGAGSTFWFSLPVK